jgi:hypothetical protein
MPGNLPAVMVKIRSTAAHASLLGGSALLAAR